MRPENGRDDGRERGWALISVLWAVAVLALLAAAMQSLSFGTAFQERRALDRAKADAAFDAGVLRAVLGLSDPRPDARWRVDGVPHDFAFAGTPMRIAVQDEDGRIDLNAADGSLIIQLLQSAGLERDDAEVLSDRIQNWRTKDTGLTRLKGGGDEQYGMAGLFYRPRHAPFQSVDELKLVLGMTPALFAKIKPALTVYSHHPAIDTATAPRAALLAYYPDQPDRVKAILDAREGTAPDGSESVAPQSGDALAGRAYDITVDVAMGQSTVRREAVVLLTKDKNRPYLTLAWR